MFPYMVLPELFVYKCHSSHEQRDPPFQLTARRHIPIPPGGRKILRAKNDEFTFLANHFWSKSWQQSFFLLDFYFPLFRIFLAAAVFWCNWICAELCLNREQNEKKWSRRRSSRCFRFCLYRNSASAHDAKTAKYEKKKKMSEVLSTFIRYAMCICSDVKTGNYSTARIRTGHLNESIFLNSAAAMARPFLHLSEYILMSGTAPARRRAPIWLICHLIKSNDTLISAGKRALNEQKKGEKERKKNRIKTSR